MVIIKENTNEPVSCKSSAEYLLCPSWCKYDENGHEITEDLEMVKIPVYFLLLVFLCNSSFMFGFTNEYSKTIIISCREIY